MIILHLFTIFIVLKKNNKKENYKFILNFLSFSNNKASCQKEVVVFKDY